eukprot:Sdes_comp14666_c0_seq1m3551
MRLEEKYFPIQQILFDFFVNPENSQESFEILSDSLCQEFSRAENFPLKKQKLSSNFPLHEYFSNDFVQINLRSFSHGLLLVDFLLIQETNCPPFETLKKKLNSAISHLSSSSSPTKNFPSLPNLHRGCPHTKYVPTSTN